jgi:hypothetical protein
MVSRRDQDAQTTAITDSRLKVYEGAGHAVHWEEPDRFASDLVGFYGGRKMCGAPLDERPAICLRST